MPRAFFLADLVQPRWGRWGLFSMLQKKIFLLFTIMGSSLIVFYLFSSTVHNVLATGHWAKWTGGHLLLNQHLLTQEKGRKYGKKAARQVLATSYLLPAICRRSGVAKPHEMKKISNHFSIFWTIHWASCISSLLPLFFVCAPNHSINQLRLPLHRLFPINLAKSHFKSRVCTLLFIYFLRHHCS